MVDPLPEDAPQFVADYYAYYKTTRLSSPQPELQRRLECTVFAVLFEYAGFWKYSSEIRSAVLLVHGRRRNSRYFSETAYGKLTGDNKEADYSWCQPHRPLRSDGNQSV